MIIKAKEEGNKFELELTGRLDANSSPDLEELLKRSIGHTELLIFDFTNIEYISSAGLRVLLAAQKVMDKQGKMIIRNPNSSVIDIMDITGFLNVFTIEQS